MGFGLNKEDLRQLRGRIDGDELEGFQLNVIRRRARPIPDWTLSDENMRRVILHRCATREKRATRAACLYLYFRVGMTDDEIAEHLDISKHVVKRQIRSSKKIASILFNDIYSKVAPSTQPMDGDEWEYDLDLEDEEVYAKKSFTF